MIQFSMGKKMAAVALLASVVGTASAWPGIYGEIGGGGYYRDLKRDSVIGAQNKPTSWKHGRMGWQAGADVGYQFWKFFAAEVGYFWLQNQKMSYDSTTTYSGTSFPAGSEIEFKSWSVYAAARINVKILVDWSVYAKLGVAYINSHVDYRPKGAAAQSGSGSLWSPLVGVGLNYYITDYFFVGMDYAFFVGNSVKKDPFYASRLTGSDVHMPSLQRLTFNLGVLI